VDDSESNQDESVSSTNTKRQEFRRDDAEPDTFADANMKSFINECWQGMMEKRLLEHGSEEFDALLAPPLSS